jgi:hypothetical protein
MAGIGINFSISGIQDLQKMQEILKPALFAKALKGGMSYAAKGAKTAAAKEIGARYNIKAARIKQDIRGPQFLDGGATARLVFSRKPPSALSYGGKDTGKGLRMKVLKSEGIKPVTRGFIGTGRIAGLPFRRVNAKGNQPIAFVSGPSIGSIFMGSGDNAQVMQQIVSDRINEQFVKGVERVLSAAARGYGI